MKVYITLTVAALALSGCAKIFGTNDAEFVNTTPATRPVDLQPPASTQTAPTRPVVTQTTLSPASPEYFRTKVGDRVLFEVDQHTLTDTGKQVLDGQIAWLRNNPSYSVVIEGHADEQGTREYNLALGARRAQAVRNYLVAGGINPNRIRTLSFGKERPTEVCSEEGCYAKNRRAVTVLAGGIS